eukprot:CAMPEP_0168620044 /NCGR_PEP_ID=MMETSP0449_2-20121227/6924_1 /TAXON_ID=1082188 /ORGANISM="Strombidium rassoulzadegani, Strain ras09" /LENGTH=78 /DNA_ID=CAMNT_0008661017 /DNA_START=267 /DNA_END=500 /DNA_ORIENTATION=-
MKSEEKIKVWEGCVSDDEYLYLVERPAYIKVKFQSLSGKIDRRTNEPFEQELILKGTMGRIFQHEYDHMDGVVVWGGE